MIKKLFFAFTCISLISCNQNSNTKTNKSNQGTSYTLPFPQGWKTELFSLPVKFAPAIAYKGVEDIRFAPGWEKATSNEYWTYCFLWCLEDSIHIDAKIIEKNLEAYYTGLIGSNVQQNKISSNSIIQTETSFDKAATANGDLETFTGTIRMLDYMKQEPITLNCMVHLTSCPQQSNTYLFHEISPKPFTDSVWKSLHQIWTGFACSSNK
ncbi:MAG TPA: hypothetical protein VMY77_09665 [Chitinophagaceae bacterium]|nr:hypothetical protein [Chitinophagaceae bacterium]